MPLTATMKSNKFVFHLVNNYTVWRKILTGENIDEFLSIRKLFPHQNFPLITFCRLHARKLFRAGCYR